MSGQMIKKEIKKIYPNTPTGAALKAKDAIQKATLKKPSAFENLAMSKPVGKILDSSIGKGMVAVGNTVKGLMPDMKKVKEDLFGSKAIDAKQKADAEKLNADNSGFKYGVQIKKKNK